MRYWDSSALVPVMVDEATTAQVRAWLKDDPEVISWRWTRVEIASAVERRTREGVMDAVERREILQRLSEWSEAWDSVPCSPAMAPHWWLRSS